MVDTYINLLEALLLASDFVSLANKMNMNTQSKVPRKTLPPLPIMLTHTQK